MKRYRLAILYLCAVLVAPRAANSVTIADFVDFSYRNPRGQVELPGRLYVPPTLGQFPGPRPLMTMLHGGGGNGTDNIAQLNFVSDGMIQAANERGALLYIPQTPNGWGSAGITLDVITMIDRAVAEWNVDNGRLYMMGYSNGGGGTWNMLSRYDGRFAAAIAMSGVAPGSDFVAARLVDTPILAIHARDDATVSVGTSRGVINSILAAAHHTLPTYLPVSNPSTFVLSNATLPFHQAMRDLVHQEPGATDFLLADPALDLMYFESATGGHTGLLGAFNAPELFDFLFIHTTAVPEPSTAMLCAPIAYAFIVRRRHKKERPRPKPARR